MYKILTCTEHIKLKCCQYSLTNEVKMNNFGPSYSSYHYFHNQIYRPQNYKVLFLYIPINPIW